MKENQVSLHSYISLKKDHDGMEFQVDKVK